MRVDRRREGRREGGRERWDGWRGGSERGEGGEGGEGREGGKRRKRGREFVIMHDEFYGKKEINYGEREKDGVNLCMESRREFMPR